MLITFVRSCALSSHILTYDLGETTKRQQALAVCHRMMWNPTLVGDGTKTCEDVMEAVYQLPEHCTYMFVCSECKRIANACQIPGAKDVPFNEVIVEALEY